VQYLNDININNWVARVFIDNEFLAKTAKTESDFPGDYKILFKIMMQMQKEELNINPVDVADRLGSFWLYELSNIMIRCLDYQTKIYLKMMCQWCGLQRKCKYCEHVNERGDSE